MAELWGCNRPGIFMRKKPLDTRPFLLDHFIRAASTFGGIVKPIWAFTLTQQGKETTKGERLLTVHSNRAQDSTEPFAVSILRSFRVSRQL